MRTAFAASLILAVPLMFPACGDDGGGAADAGLDASPGPSLEGIAPPEGPVGTEVTLSGANLGSSGTVEFGAVPAAIVSWSETEVVAVVPDVVPGEIEIRIANRDGATRPQPWRVILPPRLYINNMESSLGQNSITVMGFDFESGVLEELAAVPTGAPAGSGSYCLRSLALHRPTRRLFATSGTHIAVFDLHPATGALAPVLGSPFEAGTDLKGIVTTADGARVYAVDAVGGVVGFDVDPAGALSPVPGSPFEIVADGAQIQRSGDGSLLFVHVLPPNQLEVLVVGSDGALTRASGSPFAVDGGGAYAMNIRPGHDQVLVGNNDEVLVFAFDAAGIPAEHASSPFILAGGNGIAEFTFTADGVRAFAPDYNMVHVLDLAADGAPTPVTGSPFDLSASSLSCAHVSEDQQYLIVTDGSDDVARVLSVAAAGNLAEVIGSPFAITAPTSAGGVVGTF